MNKTSVKGWTPLQLLSYRPNGVKRNLFKCKSPQTFVTITRVPTGILPLYSGSTVNLKVWIFLTFSTSDNGRQTNREGNSPQQGHRQQLNPDRGSKPSLLHKKIWRHGNYL